MNRTFPLLIILLMSMVSTLMQEPQLQDNPLQNAGAGHFKASILREDGVLIPFAEYREGKWSAPWPKREGYGNAENSLADLPEAWFVKDGEFSATWYFWPSDGSPKVLQANKTVKVVNHGPENWGLACDYPGKPLQANEHHKNIGIALDVEKKVESPLELPNSSPDSKRILKFIQPASLPSDAARQKAELTLRNLYRNRSAIDSRYIYHFRAEKEYRKTGSSSDPDCNDISILKGWILQNQQDELKLLDSQIALTDCDMKTDFPFVRPLGILTMGDRTFIFTEDHGYEDESYSIFELNGSSIKCVLNIYGGGA
jgi:hypothetical protein